MKRTEKLTSTTLKDIGAKSEAEQTSGSRENKEYESSGPTQMIQGL
jgi:hypothetical protein